MASDLSTYLGNLLCRWLNGDDMPTAPAFLEVGLFDGNPKTSGVEVTNDITGYGRPVANWDAVPLNGTDITLTLASTLSFGEAENIADFSHVAIFDNSGNLLASKVLSGGPFTTEVGGLVSWAAGDLEFTIGSAT